MSDTPPDAIAFTVPMRPKPKGRPRFGRGRTYTPKATAAFEGELALRAGAELGGRTLLGPLELHLTFVFRRTRVAPKGKGRAPRTCAPDLDNLAKAVMDALTGAQAWEDDRQVTRISAAKWWGEAGEDSSISVGLGPHKPWMEGQA